MLGFQGYTTTPSSRFFKKENKPRGKKKKEKETMIDETFQYTLGNRRIGTWWLNLQSRKKGIYFPVPGPTPRTS
jgi:hypothetical protein